jgi:hypothetical protein
MGFELWDLFRETGEPMGYLLYRAEKKQKNQRQEQKRTGAQERPLDRAEGTPTASA